VQERQSLETVLVLLHSELPTKLTDDVNPNGGGPEQRVNAHAIELRDSDELLRARLAVSSLDGDQRRARESELLGRLFLGEAAC